MNKKYIKKIVNDLNRFKEIQVLKEKRSLHYDTFYIPIEQVEIWRKSVDEYIPFLLQLIKEFQKLSKGINIPDVNLELAGEDDESSESNSIHEEAFGIEKEILLSSG